MIDGSIVLFYHENFMCYNMVIDLELNMKKLSRVPWFRYQSGPREGA